MSKPTLTDLLGPALDWLAERGDPREALLRAIMAPEPTTHTLLAALAVFDRAGGEVRAKIEYTVMSSMVYDAFYADQAGTAEQRLRRRLAQVASVVPALDGGQELFDEHNSIEAVETGVRRATGWIETTRWAAALFGALKDEREAHGRVDPVNYGPTRQMILQRPVRR